MKSAKLHKPAACTWPKGKVSSLNDGLFGVMKAPLFLCDMDPAAAASTAYSFSTSYTDDKVVCPLSCQNRCGSLFECGGGMLSTFGFVIVTHFLGNSRA